MTKLFTLSEKKVQKVLEHAKVKLVEKSYGSRFPSTTKYPRKRVTKATAVLVLGKYHVEESSNHRTGKKREMLRC